MSFQDASFADSWLCHTVLLEEQGPGGGHQVQAIVSSNCFHKKVVLLYC